MRCGMGPVICCTELPCAFLPAHTRNTPNVAMMAASTGIALMVAASNVCLQDRLPLCVCLGAFRQSRLESKTLSEACVTGVMCPPGISQALWCWLVLVLVLPAGPGCTTLH